MKLQQIAAQVYTVAVNEANLNSHEYITPEHFLYALLMFEVGREIFRHSGGDIPQMTQDLTEYFAGHLLRSQGEFPTESKGFIAMLERAVRQAQGSQKNEIALGDLLISMFELPESFAVHIMLKNGVDRLAMLRYISHGKGQKPEARGQGLEKDKAAGKGSDSLLAKYCVELVERARNGELDPLIGRAVELREIELQLCRRSKSNPVLVGDAGVGKTAIVEGLAQRIAADNTYKPLRGTKIYHMDMGNVLAGTRYRGDFEDRLIGILDEAAAQKNAIIYIDEIHTVVGAGAVSSGAMDATSILKPYLTRGGLRFIGATTFEEYKKHFEKDSALTRRFQKIDINEPSSGEAIEILQGLIDKYQEFHGVKYDADAVEQSVSLAQKFLHDRRLPDVAIDIIDQAGAVISNEGLRVKNEELRVGVADVERVVAQMARVPENTISADERHSLATLEKRLSAQVYGQDEAITAVVGAIKAARSGLNDPNKPVASLLFVGPTGVGKTEVARILGDALNIPLVRFDMSEYQEAHSTARLIGSPPGYVGYDEGGLLTDALRKTPHCVLLLDEIEKAHVNITNVLLQVMDYGKLTDNTGKKADFRNAIIIMTSNAGAREADRGVIGFGGGRDSTAMDKEISRIFAPEFRNRLNKIIRFNHIDPDMARKIAKKALGVLEGRLAAKDIKISASPAVINHIAEAGFSAQYGAREIIRLVEGRIKEQLAEAILSGADFGGNVKLALKNGEVVCQVPLAKPAKPPKKSAKKSAAGEQSS